ncbi:MAG: dihydrolipoyl dehydrogenase [Gallionellales bacterium 35-53-114]|jgi:dihydrolipoamide dehydrogenase|nr:MAG: dihydrolipoyl dehydrogenase [Gallionellales bacterium 35-53-114]OYZ64313.1 MAG: dihydrolipoyl dehydrogenase [Gallionellales bacterium 24-53-125]OZB10379.1 MAG: dihydrolipoyl dehydrogenase [Gallionellales bacterium 39-52-133]HQS56988.1 dihydrolipoyl dehydrogenase [Gallionellaceae bacterium]HQS75228.1 dihydrolipoyl dehydrogenase [Gallionellaceae bacterium]
MSKTIAVNVPDIGNFKDIPVIEILVKVGDTVSKEQSLITLETDKATMDVPAPEAGIVKELKLKVGDTVSEGSLILMLEAAEQSQKKIPPAPPLQSGVTTIAAAAAIQQNTAPHFEKGGLGGISAPSVKGDIHAEVVVLGAGPGGYTAAFRAADLGKQVVLIEKFAALGGVCLNVGCIPSKALLHVAKVISEAEEVSHHGVTFSKPKIDINKIRSWKESVIGKLTGGLAGLAKQRKVQVVQGVAKFASANSLAVETKDGKKTITFDNCIVAAGSSVARIPGFPYDDERIIDSTGALALADVPKRMLIIGGGIIGLEMATVYDALGSKISVVELMDQLIPGADKDLVKPLYNRIAKRYEAIYLKTKVSKIDAKKEGLLVTFEGDNAPAPQLYDRVLMAVGRRPNGREIAAEAAGVTVNERGFIPVDKQQRTNIPHIYAIGDIVGDPMLAHKAVHEGKVAAEVIAGHKASFDALTIPSVAYTDPEISWMGLTETQAKAQGIKYEKASFPWAASGRALSVAREEGLTKLLYDPETMRILGSGIVGVNAGELLAESVLALEMGADMQDLALTIHPHPTLSETIGFAAEIAEGSITDLYMPKKKH